MAEIPSSQHEYLGRSASEYEQRRSSDPKWLAEQACVDAFLASTSSSGVSVLDVPVGTGRFLEIYGKRGDQVTGVDISKEMLDEARDKAEALGMAGVVSLEEGSIYDLPVPDDSFRVAVCIRLLNLIDRSSVESAMSELDRVSSEWVIVGIRTHGTDGRLWRVARSARSLITRRQDKLTVHPENWWLDLVSGFGAKVVERRMISSSAHKFGDYHIYLLAVGEDSAPQ